MAKNHGTKWDRIYTAVVVPYKQGTFDIDYEALSQTAALLPAAEIR